MRRFVLFAIALIAIAIVLQALVQPRAINSGRALRLQYQEPRTVSATSTVPTTHARATTMPPAGGVPAGRGP